MLFSVFPTGGGQGTTVHAELRGLRLDGAYAVWFDSGALQGRLIKTERLNEEFKPKVNQREKKPEAQNIDSAEVEIQIDNTVSPGGYTLRLVSPHGVSNPVSFPVMKGPVVMESSGPHQTSELAQAVTVPGIINGKVAEPGEQDFYSFHAGKGATLQFEAIRGQKAEAAVAEGKFNQFTPQVALYRAGGSWFDSNRPTRLLFKEERISDLMQEQSGGTYRFDEEGEYLLQVSGVFGQGCHDCTYQLRVKAGDSGPRLGTQEEEAADGWLERSLSRNLSKDWMTQLEARSVPPSEPKAPLAEASQGQGGNSTNAVEPQPRQAPNPPIQPLSFVEFKPKDGVTQIATISVPAVIEGAILHPGDIDSFRFKVESGERLAFEVETPDTKPPYFNPRLGIVDSQNKELFSNVERRLSMFNNNSDPQIYLKSVGPKAIYTFERGGEYVLQVRDITSRYGGSDFRYKIFVRPEIPHLGEVVVAEGKSTEGAKVYSIDRINLTPGEPKEFTLIASYEEGFVGDLSFTFTGLPEGVQAFPAVQFHKETAPIEVTQSPEIIAPKEQKATVVLLAVPGAKTTSAPKMIQLHCQLIANGKLGPSLLVQEVPLMVVEGQEKTPQKTDKAK
jgi:hypothetical protein